MYLQAPRAEMAKTFRTSWGENEANILSPAGSIHVRA
jgi:hypothetical protein